MAYLTWSSLYSRPRSSESGYCCLIQPSVSHIGLRGVVGFFGFNSDRRVALQALAVAATKDDIHAVFAGSSCHFDGNYTKILNLYFSRLALMTYHGSVLLLARGPFLFGLPT